MIGFTPEIVMIEKIVYLISDGGIGGGFGVRGLKWGS